MSGWPPLVTRESRRETVSSHRVWWIYERGVAGLTKKFFSLSENLQGFLGILSTGLIAPFAAPSAAACVQLVLVAPSPHGSSAQAKRHGFLVFMPFISRG